MTITTIPEAKLHQKATLLVMLSASLYGCLGFFGIKLLEQHFSVACMLFWRFLIAMLWMILLNGKNMRITLLQHKKVSLLFAFFIGALFYSGSSLYYFLASELTGTGPAMVIFYAYPIFIILFTIIMEKRWVKKPVWFALLIIVLGLYLLKDPHSTHALNTKGIYYAILAALCYALYFYASKYTTNKISSYSLTIMVCGGCCTLFLILSLYEHSFTWPSRFSGWGYILALGIFATALPIQLLQEGLKYVHPEKASILSALEPCITFTLGILLLKEPFILQQVIGEAIIIFAAIGVQLKNA